jgi:ubiquinone/menaquinone biosynthesis C-methylase UbiE
MKSRYERETRAAYQDTQRAEEYQQQTRRLTWARLATWRELGQVRRMLAECRLGSGDLVLDAPCGTGIAGQLLGQSGVSVVALDIAMEMMALAREDYRVDRLCGFVRADMKALPFPARAFTGALVLGFMHRVPDSLQNAVLRDLVRVVDRYLILTFSVDNRFQRFKRSVLQRMHGRRYTAPVPRTLADIRLSLEAQGLSVRRCRSVLPALSSSVVILAERT